MQRRFAVLRSRLFGLAVLVALSPATATAQGAPTPQHITIQVVIECDVNWADGAQLTYDVRSFSADPSVVQAIEPDGTIQACMIASVSSTQVVGPVATPTPVPTAEPTPQPTPLPTQTPEPTPVVP